jgi:hypothetical protein
MARWIVDWPESADRDRLRSQLLNNAELTRSTRLQAVRNLVPLFDGAPLPPDDTITPSYVVRASRLFRELYTHAAPFSREALAELWRRCEADPKRQQSCVSQRVEAERSLDDAGS